MKMMKKRELQEKKIRKRLDNYFTKEIDCNLNYHQFFLFDIFKNSHTTFESIWSSQLLENDDGEWVGMF